MGQPGAKKNDQIVSATPGDVHIIMVPSPGGPVPTPIPHPCASIINDACAEKVKVMGQPGAVKGSKSKHTPPHIPMGPGPFQKPPKNAGKIVTGSANVFYQGKEAAMLGDTAEMCSDPSDTPVGKVMGTAATVLVGGGGSGSDEARAQAAAKAMLAAQAAAARMKDATTSGHPINVANGDLVVCGDDFGLDGPLPIQFVRTYVSARAESASAMGFGWAHNLQERIALVAPGHPAWNATHEAFLASGAPSPDDRYLTYYDPNGVATTYHAPSGENPEIFDSARQRRLRASGPDVHLVLRSGVTSRFASLRGDPSELALVEVIDRNGNRNRYRYDGEGRPIEVADCYDRRLLLAYEGDRLASIAVRASRHADTQLWCRYRYDERGDLVEVIDRAGRSVHYAYADHRMIEDRNRDHYSFYFTYDALGRCVSTWGHDGYLTRHFRYDAVKKRTLEINGEGEQTVYHYTDAGVVWKTEKGADFAVVLSFDDRGRWVGRRSGGTPVIAISYDDADNVAAMTDGDGATRQLEYNEFGQVTRMVDPLGVETLLTYDARGNLATHTDASGTTHFERDERGREVRRTLPNGRAIETRYDAFGHPSELRSGHRVARLEYDPLGNLLRSRLPHGAESTVEWTPSGYPSRIARNGRTVRAYAYTAGGDVCEQLDAYGRRIVRDFGAPGVAVRERLYSDLPGAGDLPIVDKTFHCDSEGRIRRVEMDGRHVSFEYDDAGRVAREATSDGDVEEYAYDDAGLQCEIAEAGGSRFVEYNGRAQVARVRDPDGGEVSFEYDGNGRLVGAVNTAAAVAIERDELGEIASETTGDDVFVRQDDAATGRRSWIDADGGRWTSEFDAVGELRGVQLGAANVSFEYDAVGNPLRRRFGNGLVESLEYDDFDRLAKSELAAGAANLQVRSIRYEGLRVGAILDSALGDRRYEYDARGRLVHVRGEADEYYAWGPRDELLDCHRERAEVEFDELGRVERIRRAGGAPLRLCYDARNQLVAVRLPDGGEVHYAYDAFGRRLEKRFVGGARDGRRVRFAWRGEEMVREAHYQGDALEVERRYLFVRNAPIACVQSGAGGERHWYYHVDHRGAPALISDERGEIVWSSRADSFGWSPEPLPEYALLGLPGQYHDEETGLAYNRHRYYDPATARYLTPDPIKGGLHKSPYSYPVDPIGEVDRLGLMATLIITMDPFDNTNMRDEQILANTHNAKITSWSSLSPNDLKGVDHVIINAHGSPNQLWATDGMGNEERVGGAAVAAKLRAKGFKGNQVTVVACEAGQSGGTFAQDCADELGPGSEVTAWPESVALSKDGDLWMVTGRQPDGSLAFELADQHARIFTPKGT